MPGPKGIIGQNKHVVRHAHGSGPCGAILRKRTALPGKANGNIFINREGGCHGIEMHFIVVKIARLDKLVKRDEGGLKQRRHDGNHVPHVRRRILHEELAWRERDAIGIGPCPHEKMQIAPGANLARRELIFRVLFQGIRPVECLAGGAGGDGRAPQEIEPGRAPRLP